jgi:hypothetical protein
MPLFSGGISSKAGARITTELGKSVYTVTGGTHKKAATRNNIPAPLAWSFGDGRIGQSYLFERDGNFFESRASYFGNLKILDLTLGRELTDLKNLEEAIGRPVTGSELIRCFACHSTASTINDNFDRTRIIPGYLDNALRIYRS